MHKRKSSGFIVPEGLGLQRQGQQVADTVAGLEAENSQLRLQAANRVCPGSVPWLLRPQSWPPLTYFLQQGGAF